MYFLHIRQMAGQDSMGTQNHSQEPGPTLTLTAAKLLFSWWPGGYDDENEVEHSENSFSNKMLKSVSQ